MRACKSGPSSRHVDTARERMEWEAGNESQHLLFFRSTASTKYLTGWRVTFSGLEVMQLNGGGVELRFLVLASGTGF